MGKNLRLLGSNSQYSRYPLARFLADMQTLGLQRLDFVPQPPHFFLSHTGYEPVDSLRAALDGAGMKVEVLTPPPYRYSITAPPGEQQDATIRYYRNAIALARELGAGSLVLGAAGACWDVNSEALFRNAAELLFGLCFAAEEAGITLLLAPVMGPDAPLIAESPVLGKAAELGALLAQVRSPRLGVCLDTNVMSAWGDSLDGWFEHLGDKIGLVRLCDGNYHGYRAWGEGVLPMERYRDRLRDCGYRGDISLLLPGERYLEYPDHPHRAAIAGMGGCGPC